MSRLVSKLAFVVFGAIADPLLSEEASLLLRLQSLPESLASLATDNPDGAAGFAPKSPLSTDLHILSEYLEQVINEEHDHMEKHGRESAANAQLIDELAKSLEVEVPAVEKLDGERIHYRVGDTNPVRSGRKVMEQVPCEFMANFNLASPANRGMKVNGTHLWLPYQHMKGTFARRTNFLDSFEFGVVHWSLSKQGTSRLGPRVKFGIMERVHTLTHTGAWSTASLDRNKAILARRFNITNTIAKKQRGRRAFLSMAAAMLYPKTLHSTMLDPLHVDAIREFVEFNGGHPEAIFSDKEIDMSDVMERQWGEAEEFHPLPSSSALDSHHFEEMPGMQTQDTGVWVPLHRKILGYHFQAQFTPIERLRAVVGPGVWRHTLKARGRAPEHIVEYYHAGTSCFEELSTKDSGGKPAMLYLSPPNLADGVVGRDGRTPSMPLGSFAAALQQMANAIPLDFYWLYEDPTTRCRTGYGGDTEKLARNLATIDFHALLNGETSPLTALLWARYMVDAVGCAAPLLSGSITTPYSNGFDAFEVIPYFHAMVETPPAIRLKILSMPELADSILN